jgi:hypothetical protein
MRTAIPGLSVVLAALSVPVPAMTQDLEMLSSGDLVRAARAQPNRLPSWVYGTVIEANYDHLMLSSIRSESVFALDWLWINRLEVSRGRKRKSVTGLVVGLLVGAPVGVTAGWIRDTGINDLTTAESMQRGLRVGLVAGLIVGGIVGTLVEVERWGDVSSAIPQRQFGTSLHRIP